MTKILIDKNELREIRDEIDDLLRDENKNVVVRASERIYNHQELNDKEKLIIDHLKKNPGHIKQQVVGNLGKYSRVPILDAIDKLVKEGMIIIEEDEANSRIHHLYVNNQHVLISLLEDLGFFKYSYFNLIDDAKETVEKLYNSKDFKRIQEGGELIDALIMPYKYLIIMYVTSDLFLWRERPLDEDTLHRKFAIVFKNLQEMHTKLYEMVPCLPFESDAEVLAKILYDNRHGLSPEKIIFTLQTFEKYGLSESAEAVMDILWKVSYPILPIVDSFYELDKEDGLLKDWRKIISRFRNIKYIPKTEQIVKIE